MRLVSHCPNCSATFRVVLDQLRIAKGWVRCGVCHHVYNAYTTLERATDPPDTTAPIAKSSVPAYTAPPAPDAAQQTKESDNPLRLGSASSGSPVAPSPQASHAPAPQPEHAVIADALPAHLSTPPAALAAPPEPDATLLPEPARSAAAQTLAPPQQEDAAPPAAEAAHAAPAIGQAPPPPPPLAAPSAPSVSAPSGPVSPAIAATGASPLPQTPAATPSSASNPKHHVSPAADGATDAAAAPAVRDDPRDHPEEGPPASPVAAVLAMLAMKADIPVPLDTSAARVAHEPHDSDLPTATLAPETPLPPASADAPADPQNPAVASRAVASPQVQALSPAPAAAAPHGDTPPPLPANSASLRDLQAAERRWQRRLKRQAREKAQTEAAVAEAEIPVHLPASTDAPELPASTPAQHIDTDSGMAAADTIQPLPQPEAEFEVPSFVRQGRRRALWHSWPMRLSLGALGMAGTALLAAQFMLHHRDMLAAQSPVARAALEQICTHLHCKLQPWKHIEAVVIDNDRLRKLDDHTYRLSLSLRNSTSHPVAMPAIEITLLNAEDRIVARRVAPADAIEAPPLLTARGEWNGSVLIGAALPPGYPPGLPIAGYRVAVFYP